MHFRLPSNPWGPRGKTKLSYVLYVTRGGKAKLGISKLSSVFHHLSIAGPRQLCVLAGTF